MILALTVDADGHVSKIDVLQSGGSDLDEAAVVAAREWTFVPAEWNGKPIASRSRVPFHFAPPAPPPELVESVPPRDLLPEQHSVPEPTLAPERSFTAGAPRAVMLTLSATLGGT